jgi:hypothetical protein
MVPVPPLLPAENCKPAEPVTAPLTLSVFPLVVPRLVVTLELFVMPALIVAVPVFETNPAIPTVPVVDIVMGAELAMFAPELRLMRIESVVAEVLPPTVIAELVPPLIELTVIGAALIGANVSVTLFAKVIAPVRTRVELPLVVIE